MRGATLSVKQNFQVCLYKEVVNPFTIVDISRIRYNIEGAAVGESGQRLHNTTVSY